MEYIFIGGTPRGFEVIKTLITHGHLPDYAVVLKEDEHETNKASSEITDLLKENKIKFSLRKKLAEEDKEVISLKKRDFAIVCGWRTLIDTKLDQYLKYGFLAAHDSLLPKYRGFAPINWAMICGEQETGVTLFRINEGETDSGPVYAQKKVSIEANDYANDVYKKIITATVDLYLQLIKDLNNGELVFTSQKESEASYTCKRTPADGRINWKQSSTEVLNFIRALAPPYPGAFCYLEEQKFIIHRAEKGKDDKRYVQYIPGRVISIRDGNIEVMCGNGTVIISEWSREAVVSSPAETVRSITVTLE